MKKFNVTFELILKKSKEMEKFINDITFIKEVYLKKVMIKKLHLIANGLFFLKKRSTFLVKFTKMIVAIPLRRIA